MVLTDLQVWVKDVIMERLTDWCDCGGAADQKVYGCDLAFTLFEKENIDGTLTYSRYEAKEWIKKYFDDLGDVLDEIDNEIGLNCSPFTECEKLQVIVLLYMAERMLALLPYIEEHWDEEITLDASTREILYREMREEFDD